MGTVAPLPPWHGLWDLVSSANGQPAPGVATIETEALPHHRTVVAAEEYPTATRTAFIVYSFSGDRAGEVGCTGPCAVTWIPVLTTGAPSVAGAIAAKNVGVVPPARGDHAGDMMTTSRFTCTRPSRRPLAPVPDFHIS